MKIILSGASGFIGKALVQELSKQGHSLRYLVRRPAKTSAEIEWNPKLETLDPKIFADVDGVINLCGRNIADKLWSPKFRQEIFESRVLPARRIAESLSKLEDDRKRFFISASAIGIYGAERIETVDESSIVDNLSFFGSVGTAWEEAALSAHSSSLRVVCPRIGVVLGRGGGMLKKLLPVFKLGLGGRLGSGAQLLSWIEIKDLTRALIYLAESDSLSGPVNLTSPNAVSNSEFTNALAELLQRPAKFSVPRFAMELIFGRCFCRETIFSSLRVLPKKLTEQGFIFESPDIRSALLKSIPQ